MMRVETLRQHRSRAMETIGTLMTEIPPKSMKEGRTSIGTLQRDTNNTCSVRTGFTICIVDEARRKANTEDRREECKKQRALASWTRHTEKTLKIPNLWVLKTGLSDLNFT